MTAIDKLIELAFENRRAAGLTVVFLHEDGCWDEWGFKDEANRDAFIRKLGDRDHHVPAWQ